MARGSAGSAVPGPGPGAGAGAPGAEGGGAGPAGGGGGPLLGRPMAACGRLAGRALGAVYRGSRGSVSVDLWCPGWKALKRAQERERRAGGGPGAGAARPARWTDHLGGWGAAGVGDGGRGGGGGGGGILDGGGVRVKAYRHWTAWEDPDSGSSLVDVAMGAAFDSAGGGSLEPRVRVRFGKIARLRLLPSPAFTAKKVWALGPLLGPSGSRLAVEACWSTPLVGLSGWEDLLQPPAGFYVRLRNASGTGPQLTARGVAFDERVAHTPSRSELWVSGGLDFPQQLPPPESEGLFGVHLDRLRITTQIP